MTGYIQAPDQTYSNIGNALASIPVNINRSRVSEQERQLRALNQKRQEQKYQADAAKSDAEAYKINQGNEARSNLARSLETLNRDMNGNPMYSGPPGNMVSRQMTPTDVAGAQAGLFLANDDPQKSVGAFRDMNDAYTSRDAVNAVNNGDSAIGSMLNAIANGQSMPDQFKINAAGATQDVFGGGVSTNNQMAQSNIAKTVAETQNLRDPRSSGKPTMIDQLPVEMQRFFQTVVNDQFGAPHTVIDEQKMRAWLGYQANTQGMDQAQQLSGFLNQYQAGQGQAGGQAGGAPQRMATIKEAMKLPSGTVFIDPRGIQRTRP